VVGTFSWRDMLPRKQDLWVLPRVSEVMQHRNGKCLACVGGDNGSWDACFGTLQGTRFLGVCW
jgi:hypothetical protein